MSRIFHPLLYLLACATRQELARPVQYLKTENEILRARLPNKIMVTPEERRRLVKAGEKLERLHRTVCAIDKQECLDHFVVLGEKHLQHIVSEYVKFYNEFRPHENREHLPPAMKEPPPEVETICLEKVVCRERLGGLLKYYE